MARRLKVLEGGAGEIRGIENRHAWRRDRKDQGFREVDDSSNIGETQDISQESQGEIPSNIPLHAADLHVRQAAGEKKESRDFFRDVLVSVIERESMVLQGGLAIIRKINSGQKIWKAVEGSDRHELKLGLLKKISSINPDNEKLLTEVEKLSNIQGYDIDGLKGKINSNPDMVAARGSSQSNEEGRKAFGKLLRRLIGNEVRDIFRNNQIANSDETLKVALHVEHVVRRGLVNIVDAPPRRIVQKKEEKTPEITVEIESEADKRKKALIKKNAEESFEDILNNHLENILQRRPGGKGRLEEGDIQVIKREFERDGVGINEDVVNRVFQELTEKMKPFEREAIDTQVFLKMREKVIERAEGYIRKKEIDLLKEQRSELVHLITEAVKFKNQFDKSQMEQVVKMVFEKDAVLKKLFPGEQLPQAISHVLNQINKFRDKK
jgi:hypothetical protein